MTDALWRAFRTRVDAMKITRLELDHLSGLQEGCSGKLLGAAQVKNFGRHSLGMTLGATCCKLVLVEDPEATAKMMARAKKRQRPIRETKSIADVQTSELQVRGRRLTVREKNRPIPEVCELPE